MKCVLKSVAIFLLPLFLCHCNPTQTQEKKDAKPSPPPAKNPTPPEKKASSSPSPSSSAERKIDIPLQVGAPAYGIKIPHTNDKGELTMEFEAGTAQRLDESKIELMDLKIVIHEENKKYFIEMPHSLFDLDTRILVSDTPTTIRREDFEITGDTAEFNTKTRFSRMVGKVKMTIFNIEPDQK